LFDLFGYQFATAACPSFCYRSRLRKNPQPISHRFLRAAHNRCLPDGDKLFARVCAGQAMGRIELAMA
jgi:hypothetical protein